MELRGTCLALGKGKLLYYYHQLFTLDAFLGWKHWCSDVLTISPNLSVIQLRRTLCDSVDCSPPVHGILSMEFSRPEYWSGLPFSTPGVLPDPGIEPRSSSLQAGSLPSDPKQPSILTHTITNGFLRNTKSWHKAFLSLRISISCIVKELFKSYLDIDFYCVSSCSVSLLFKKHNNFSFQCQISVKSFWRHCQQRLNQRLRCWRCPKLNDKDDEMRNRDRVRACALHHRRLPPACDLRCRRYHTRPYFRDVKIMLKKVS